MKKYLTFIEQPNPGRKTKIFHIQNIITKDFIGHIKWNRSWRQYCFDPDTTWSNGCLREIADFIDKLYKERKQ